MEVEHLKRSTGDGWTRAVPGERDPATVRTHRGLPAIGKAADDPAGPRVPEDRLALLRGGDERAGACELNMRLPLARTHRIPPLPKRPAGGRVEQQEPLGRGCQAGR